MDEKDMMTVELDDFKGAVSSTEKALKEQGDLAQEAVDNMQNSVEEALGEEESMEAINDTLNKLNSYYEKQLAGKDDEIKALQNRIEALESKSTYEEFKQGLSNDIKTGVENFKSAVKQNYDAARSSLLTEAKNISAARDNFYDALKSHGKTVATAFVSYDKTFGEKTAVEQSDASWQQKSAAFRNRVSQRLQESKNEVDSLKLAVDNSKGIPKLYNRMALNRAQSEYDCLQSVAKISIRNQDHSDAINKAVDTFTTNTRAALSNAGASIKAAWGRATASVQASKTNIHAAFIGLQQGALSKVYGALTTAAQKVQSKMSSTPSVSPVGESKLSQLASKMIQQGAQKGSDAVQESVDAYDRA